MTAQTFDLPDLGEGLTEAEVVKWLVAVGDTVAVDQPIAEVETAKSIVEVPSPFAGTVSVLHGEEGEVLEVGKPLITVGSGSPAEAPAAEPPAAEEPDAETKSPAPAATGAEADTAGERYREEERAGSGNVLIGYGTPESTGSGRRRRPRNRPPSHGSQPSAPAAAPVPAPARRVPLVTSPLVRQLAREAGLRVADIEGSGPGGLITRRDVRSAIEAAGANTAPAPSAPIAASTPAAPAQAEPGAVDARTGLAESKREAMGAFRKAVATSLSRSRSEIPEATVWVDVDATELVRLRRSDPEGPGLLAYVARFVLAGLHAYPELNGLVDTEREELVQYDGVNLGLAVQTDRGLVAPAVMGAHKLTTAELDTEIKELTRLARAGKATPAQLTGGTFTLNNFGSLRVDGSAAIINHPQVAILGIGRIIDRPWVVDGELTVRKITQLSFAFDHRVCDGGAAAGFMRVVADAMENPARAIARL
ncbi:dihydrolipoamide acetyltransferase component of pyruvate dehydrogenase complex [Nocardiopsis terrae]|uniref:Dihydrolipoamide acetyltransferase component of pyruvate dehydrogenase complex n=1 Tax=Nocardiopsis terrae TaxID=372655 RepID=A0ABR9HPD8_9ACTN|nr:dihydrolipoamide acetyltransferase family protein [Nocardiopsis terrae]MBE1460877.1 pyruvate dehydrogenase E2 component (dihydrolipoamide acetyltransferase) [Nocardiopsis terrae]GHC73922.1 dihydrolipoamide acetyltransferase component of pyruvate dehydrogenase complex [Nocardiopsis terrae]